MHAWRNLTIANFKENAGIGGVGVQCQLAGFDHGGVWALAKDTGALKNNSSCRHAEEPVVGA